MKKVKCEACNEMKPAVMVKDFRGHKFCAGCYVKAVKEADHANAVVAHKRQQVNVAAANGNLNAAAKLANEVYEGRDTVPFALRAAVRKAQGHKCACCGKHDLELEVHHVVPFRVGGTNAPENLVALCHHCHYAADKENDKRYGGRGRRKPRK